MDFTYHVNDDWTFPQWFDVDVPLPNDDLMGAMDISQWCAENFGPVGEDWGYERKVVTEPHPVGLNPVRIRMHYTTVHYSWRFKTKNAAMRFKLRWHP